AAPSVPQRMRFSRFAALGMMLTVAGCASTAPPPDTPIATTPIECGLQWLVRHQAPDGRWSAVLFPQQCSGVACRGLGEDWADVGVTGLSLLAFLGGDHLRFADNLEKGFNFLLRSQDHSGLIGPPDEKYMYGHAMATLALCEALLKTGNAKLREPAQRAVDFLVAAQNPKKGWRYKERSRDNDSSVTAWAVLALWGAEMAGLSFPKAAYDGAIAWYAEATDEQDLRTGYVYKRDWRKENLSPNNHFDDHPTSSA